MSELLKWKISFPVFRLRISIHLLFWVFAGYILLGSLTQDPVPGVHPLGCAALGLAILIPSVLAHEIGHLIAARRVRGDYEELLLWPLGGLAPPQLSAWGKEDRAAGGEQIFVALAGPLVNFAICLTLLPLAVLLNAPVVSWLNPLAVPTAVDQPALTYTLALAFWINAVLVIANLLPGFPLDGARVLRGVLRRRLDPEEATVWAFRVSIAVAALLVLVGLVVEEVTIRLPVVFLGFFVFFAAWSEVDRFRQQPENDTFLGYDFSEGYTSLERTAPTGEVPNIGPAAVRKGNFVSRWLARRRQAREARQREVEAHEEQRFDELLAKIHQAGNRDCLTDEERRLMERVSRRVRSRLQG